MTDPMTTEPATSLHAVEFIDAWLNENSTWIDSRIVDFALDVRTLLSSDAPAPEQEREPVGADA